MATEAEAFSWSCTMPEKKASSFDRRRPQATLEADGMGKRKIPVEVARALKKAEADRSSGYMSSDELLEAEGQIEEQCAWQKTAETLNRRDCTVSELTERLAERGYGRPAIDSALAIAQKKHLVDDRRYAKRFCEQKIRAGWGRRKIELELARRGVALGEDIGWSEAAGDEDEAERALALARRKHVSSGNEYQKLVRYLAGRGYSFELATRAAKQALAERRSSEDI